MAAVADTSPLNYLICVELTEILPQLFAKVIIPPEVRSELLASDAPTKVRSWATNLPDWIEVRAPDPALRDDPRWRRLHLGERASLALAAEIHPSVVLIDERAGSEIARASGLAVTGTLGVLDQAARRGWISLPAAIERLKRTSFRYPKAIVERLLHDDARRNDSPQIG
jgi:predicted nucleic acid-binding protein